MRGDHGERLIPGDRYIVVRRPVIAHRLRQPALLFQPVIAVLRQLGHGVRGEEFAVTCAWSARMRRPWRRSRRTRKNSCAWDQARRSRDSRSRPAGSSTAAPWNPSRRCFAHAAPLRWHATHPNRPPGSHTARKRCPAVPQRAVPRTAMATIRAWFQFSSAMHRCRTDLHPPN